MKAGPDDGWTRDRRIYFAYGQDLHPAMIEARGGPALVLAVARLDGFRLDFSGRSAYWGGGEENALPEEGGSLWGVAYSLSFRDADALDERSGARLDGNGPYFHFPAIVRGADGGEYKALLLRKDARGKPRPPSRAQLECIVSGARARGLPEAYVAELSRREIDAEARPSPGRNLFSRPPAAICECADLRASKGGPGLAPAGIAAALGDAGR